MARPKAGEVNKSEVARTLLREQPKAKVRDVVEQMAKKGIVISPNQVYFIKAKLKGRRRKQQREQATQAAARSGLTNPVQAIIRVRQLAESVGGMKSLKQLVDMLAE